MLSAHYMISVHYFLDLQHQQKKIKAKLENKLVRYDHSNIFYDLPQKQKQCREQWQEMTNEKVT